MRLALHAEWTKIRTIASPLWLLLGTVAATVVLSAVVTSVMTCGSAGCAGDTTKLVAILAAGVVSSEYRSGMICTTLAAMPHRGTVLAAKAIILTGAVAAAGTVAVLGSLLAGRLILPGHGFTAARGYPALSLADAPTLRAAIGSVLYLALIALLSLGIATVLRDSAASIGMTLGLLYLFPIIAEAVGNPHWQRLLQQIGPMSAGLNIQATTDLGSLPISPWAGLGVLAAWAAAALLAGGLLLRMRDA
jgi:ABC-2 type transport system permease protein